MTQCTCHLAGWRGEGHSSECLVTIEESTNAYQDELEAKVKLQAKRIALLESALEQLCKWSFAHCNSDQEYLREAYFVARQVLKEGK